MASSISMVPGVLKISYVLIYILSYKHTSEMTCCSALKIDADNITDQFAATKARKIDL